MAGAKTEERSFQRPSLWRRVVPLKVSLKERSRETSPRTSVVKVSEASKTESDV